MTVSEAIKMIQCRIYTASEIVGKGEDGKAFEDLEMAIKVLEEIEQYREIGTVEELKDMKNNYYEAVSDWRQYKKVGTVEVFKYLKEKNTPKKPLEVYEEGEEKDDYYCVCFICPSCSGARLGESFKPNYCKCCGQLLDWNRKE